MSATNLIFLGLLTLLLLPIVLTDLRERRIPNYCNALLAATGLAYALAMDPTLQRLGISFAQAGLTLVILLAMSWMISRLNARAIVGYGDIKFLVAASFWVGLLGALMVLLLASLMTIGVSLLSALSGRGMGWREPRPFGPALAASLLLLAAFAFWRMGDGGAVPPWLAPEPTAVAQSNPS